MRHSSCQWTYKMHTSMYLSTLEYLSIAYWGSPQFSKRTTSKLKASKLSGVSFDWCSRWCWDCWLLQLWFSWACFNYCQKQIISLWRNLGPGQRKKHSHSSRKRNRPWLAGHSLKWGTAPRHAQCHSPWMSLLIDGEQCGVTEAESKYGPAMWDQNTSVSVSWQGHFIPVLCSTFPEMTSHPDTLKQHSDSQGKHKFEKCLIPWR